MHREFNRPIPISPACPGNILPALIRTPVMVDLRMSIFQSPTGRDQPMRQITGITKLLIANRGEIALRIGRTAADMGIDTVAVFPADDEHSMHVQRSRQRLLLPGHGAAAYMDMDAVITAAHESGADAIHPGYGFLAEQPEFARRTEKAGLIFVGPTPDTLALLGDKTAARQLAQNKGIPVLPGTGAATTLAQAQAFFRQLPDGAAVVIKAVAGGGGRGMRVVRTEEELESAWQRCRSEAASAFGIADVYVEQFLPSVRHLEVQILGDGTGTCIHFGERECTLQRRHQKLVEIAPAPLLPDATRQVLIEHALTLSRDTKYRSLGTFEFLLATDAPDGENLFFLEANPRIQVEHTVTEEVYGVDLVQWQLEIAGGNSLAGHSPPENTERIAHGFAIQCRINMERMDALGKVTPSTGTISLYEPPTGQGIRVDGYASTGYRSSAEFDSLLAKLVVHSRGNNFASAVRKTVRALDEFRISGIDTNLPFLRALMAQPAVQRNDVTTAYIGQHSEILAALSGSSADATEIQPVVTVPMQATVVSIDVKAGDAVQAGQQLVVLEAMKMEHVITAAFAGTVERIDTTTGATVMQGDPLCVLSPGDDDSFTEAQDDTTDPDNIRDDLQELINRRASGLDENRPQAVAKRHARGQQTARENLSQLCDPGTFVEYGELAIAAQRHRRPMEDLIENTSGDGILTGIAQVNGEQFGEQMGRCALAIGDYMVLAGTQGQRHHQKLDRLLKIAGEWHLPLILFAEGGGGRPGDTERSTYAGISNGTFTQFANLSGQVPLVGVVSGRCFAGNAALLGCCDVIIADESSNIGMAGPAMIEGGGLGVYPPEAIGPVDEQWKNGVIDIRVRDEAEACATARKYLSYFQGPVSEGNAPDQRLLRHMIPENRLRVYDIRRIIHCLADEDSVLELRAGFADGMVTALVRIEGRPFGLIANNPRHLGGAIDADAADKASRFIQLCDAFDIPLVSLCDTPGFMVGPEAEKTALVRHVSRMFVNARSITVPVFSIVVRKCYGLGAQAMLGGGAHDNFFTVSWPTGEFGPMGLEGAVKLGYRRELDALDDPAEKQALYERLLAESYQQGKAISVASTFEVDAVIDPQDTRKWIMSGLRSVRLRPPLSGRKRPCVDAW